MTPPPCILCGQPATHELLVRNARTRKHACEACLSTLGAAKHKVQDEAVARRMEEQKARVAILMSLGLDAPEGNAF
jgi:hypothetical protein